MLSRRYISFNTRFETRNFINRKSVRGLLKGLVNGVVTENEIRQLKEEVSPVQPFFQTKFPTLVCDSFSLKSISTSYIGDSTCLAFTGKFNLSSRTCERKVAGFHICNIT